MTDIDQRLGDPGNEMHVLDEAISAILYLGERLSSAKQAEAAPQPESGLDPDEAESLFRAIEGEIIPRLMLAHQSRSPGDMPVAFVDRPIVTSEDRVRFLENVMSDSANAASRFVDALLDRGVTRETIFLDLLADAARRLGELWEEDRCDFTDVTIGLCRLHQVLREHSEPGMTGDPDVRVEGSRLDGSGVGPPRILLATACADQHVFGVVMVAEFFRRDGWQVWSEPGASRSALVEMLSGERFDVLGLSAAVSVDTGEVADEVRAFRKASRNEDMQVLVGGRLFVDSPQLIAKVGADGAALDAKAAPSAANGLIARVRVSC